VIPPDSLQSLVSTIENVINARGRYHLMDERLKLICGDEADLSNLLPYEAVLIEFALKHNWRVEVSRGMVTFSRK
jgi:hypothetical protein